MEVNTMFSPLNFFSFLFLLVSPLSFFLSHTLPLYTRSASPPLFKNMNVENRRNFENMTVKKKTNCWRENKEIIEK
jgi:hypothetical protein